MTDLSILITSYNNSVYIKDVIERVRINFPDAQISVCDDASIDNSWDILRDLFDKSIIDIFYFNPWNMGYGYSLKKLALHSDNKYIAFQDSDLEYDPYDMYPLYWAITEPYIGYHYGRMVKADVAYGRRTHYGIRNPLAWLGRTIVNGLFYVMYGFKIRDVCTAYKVMPRQLLLDLDIRANDFRFSIELGAKLILGGYKVVEIPIDYYPRTTQGGKSIRWIDGVRMIISMIKWRVK